MKLTDKKKRFCLLSIIIDSRFFYAFIMTLGFILTTSILISFEMWFPVFSTLSLTPKLFYFLCLINANVFVLKKQKFFFIAMRNRGQWRYIMFCYRCHFVSGETTNLQKEKKKTKKKISKEITAEQQAACFVFCAFD